MLGKSYSFTVMKMFFRVLRALKPVTTNDDDDNNYTKFKYLMFSLLASYKPTVNNVIMVIS